MRAVPLSALVAALILPTCASAAHLEPWLGVNGSWGTYSMGDVNRELNALNRELQGSGLWFEEINNGPGFGVTAGLDVGAGFSFGIGYDRLFASSSVEDATGSLKYRLPANALRAFEEYKFPTKGPLGVAIGAGAGIVRAARSVELTSVGSPAIKYELTGSGPLFEIYLSGEWWGQPRCALTASLGYRSAKVSELSVDYGHLLMRLGLKVPLMK